MPAAEKRLIASIRERAARAAPSRGRTALIAGIGDDCAVLRPRAGHEILITTDFSLEGIHFRRDWHSPESIGHRCLARGLSDIAAMGGKPVAAFLSLALPPNLRGKWGERFIRSLLRLAGKYGVVLAGGDTAESPAGILADIVVMGWARRGKSILRSGARPGDILYVSGKLGSSAAAIAGMAKSPKAQNYERDHPRHFFPEPRIAVGCILSEKGLASAMIDTSDGLSTDLSHLCEESGAGAEVESWAIPRANKRRAGPIDPDLALHGGEDYELLFTAPRRRRVPRRIAGVPITPIGHITRGSKILLVERDGTSKELKPRGYEHFGK